MQLYQKDTLTQMCSCEFCEISSNTFFIEHLWATASEQVCLMSININIFTWIITISIFKTLANAGTISIVKQGFILQPKHMAMFQ